MNSTRNPYTLSTLSQRLPKLLSGAAVDVDGREKGPKAQDSFEVWHHHASLRRPSDWALMLQFDQRR